jgi:hypothetical protein
MSKPTLVGRELSVSFLYEVQVWRAMNGLELDMTAR